MNKCIECNKCKHHCEMLRDYDISPKQVFKGENLIEGSSSCNMCGLCKVVCPKGLYLGDEFLNYRKKDIKEKNSVFSKAKSFQKVTANRMFISKGKDKKKVLFLPGCSLASHESKVIKNIKSYLEDNIGETNVYVDCCGKPAKVSGDQETYEKISQKYIENIKSMDGERIITACGNCYNILKKNDVDVELLWDVISEYGIKSIKKSTSCEGLKVKIHDPCSLRYQEKTHESIRTVLKEMGVQYEEMEYNRKNTKCCGAGGMLGIINPVYASKVGERRVKDEDVILCYCQSCKEFFNNFGGQAIHIVDLLFNESKINSQKKKTSYTRWKNRFINRHI